MNNNSLPINTAFSDSKRIILITVAITPSLNMMGSKAACNFLIRPNVLDPKNEAKQKLIFVNGALHDEC